MEAKDKMIGAVLIIVGIFFIGLGVFVNMQTSNAKIKNNIYKEQVIENNTNTVETTEQDEVENEEIEVYTETDTQNTEQDTTKYIY